MGNQPSSEGFEYPSQQPRKFGESSSRSNSNFHTQWSLDGVHQDFSSASQPQNFLNNHRTPIRARGSAISPEEITPLPVNEGIVKPLTQPRHGLASPVRTMSMLERPRGVSLNEEIVSITQSPGPTAASSVRTVPRQSTRFRNSLASEDITQITQSMRTVSMPPPINITPTQPTRRQKLVQSRTVVSSKKPGQVTLVASTSTARASRSSIINGQPGTSSTTTAQVRQNNPKTQPVSTRRQQRNTASKAGPSKNTVSNNNGTPPNQVKSVKKSNNGTPQKQGKSSTKTAASSSSPPPPKGLQPCHHCKQTGHASKKCPSRIITCYNCQQVGHLRKNCPSRSSASSSVSQSSRASTLVPSVRSPQIPIPQPPLRTSMLVLKLPPQPPSHVEGLSYIVKECMICAEELELVKFARITSKCKHKTTVCRACVGQHIAHELADKGNIQIRCPSDNACQCILQEADVKRFASPDDLKKFRKLTLSRMPDFQWCANPRCDSGQIHNRRMVKGDASIMTCNECKQRTCVVHHIPIKNSSKCMKCMDQRSEERRQKNLKRFNELSEKFINIDTTPCPRCKCRITKIDGCDHMTCRAPGCSYEFCWICSADYLTIAREGNHRHERTCKHYRAIEIGFPVFY